MQNSTLIKLIATLDDEEWKRFEKFVHSPYFNSNTASIQLFNHLKKYYPSFEAPKLRKEKVYQKLFPNKPYKEKRMWQLMSDLKKLAEQFLVVERVKKDKTYFQIQLNECYQEKDIYDWYEQKSLALSNQLNHSNQFEAINFFHLHKIHHSLYYNNQSNKELINHPNLKTSFEQLDNYYHLQQLKYACEWVARAFRYKEDIPTSLQSISPHPRFENNLLYKLYYFIFLLYQYPISKESELFQKISQLLKTNLLKLPHEDQIALLLYLINFGIRKYQLNYAHYGKKVLNLYEYGLQHQLLLYRGKLPETVFMNILAFYLFLNQPEAAENFTQQHVHFLKKEVQEKQTIWSKLRIAFNKKKYLETIQLADSFTFKRPKQELGRRSIQIRACFEYFLIDKSYYQLLVTKSQNFEKYLKRKDILTASKNNIYANLNKYIRNLAVLIFEKQDVAKFENLLQQVLQERELGAKDWLLRHIKNNQPSV